MTEIVIEIFDSPELQQIEVGWEILKIVDGNDTFFKNGTVLFGVAASMLDLDELPVVDESDDLVQTSFKKEGVLLPTTEDNKRTEYKFRILPPPAGYVDEFGRPWYDTKWDREREAYIFIEHAEPPQALNIASGLLWWHYLIMIGSVLFCCICAFIGVSYFRAQAKEAVEEKEDYKDELQREQLGHFYDHDDHQVFQSKLYGNKKRKKEDAIDRFELIQVDADEKIEHETDFSLKLNSQETRSGRVGTTFGRNPSMSSKLAHNDFASDFDKTPGFGSSQINYNNSFSNTNSHAEPALDAAPPPPAMPAPQNDDEDAGVEMHKRQPLTKVDDSIIYSL